MRVIDDGGIVIAYLEGELDLFSSGELGHELSHVPNDSRGLVIDLTDVSYVDSSGLRILFETARRLQTARQHLGISVPTDSPLRRLFELTNMASVVSLCASVEECLQAFPLPEPPPV